MDNVNPRQNLILEKTFEFSLNIIKVHRFLTEDKREFVMSKQLLRSATSIGANCEEAGSAQSHRDFIAKMSISLKEAKESRYWIRLLLKSKFLSNKDILEECVTIIKILTKILITAKENENK
ncbi:four helix bundle protein [bacterium]|nr:four helix bundle protein [bacterium]MBU1065984.1 four helix bundle protein [bacterium]MBU1633347.1 four helix bundle protein [bacterium]MBU1872998.1 four helix bundle protein [bacterium]